MPRAVDMVCVRRRSDAPNLLHHSGEVLVARQNASPPGTAPEGRRAPLACDRRILHRCGFQIPPIRGSQELRPPEVGPEEKEAENGPPRVVPHPKHRVLEAVKRGG